MKATTPPWLEGRTAPFADAHVGDIVYIDASRNWCEGGPEKITKIGKDGSFWTDRDKWSKWGQPLNKVRGYVYYVSHYRSRWNGKPPYYKVVHCGADGQQLTIASSARSDVQLAREILQQQRAARRQGQTHPSRIIHS